MHENIEEIKKLGRIPKEQDMSDELFRKFDSLIQIDRSLTFKEAESIIDLFSEDCDDLNWAFLHAVETVPFKENIDEYRALIEKCNNSEFKEVLETRLNNYLKKNQ